MKSGTKKKQLTTQLSKFTPEVRDVLTQIIDEVKLANKELSFNPYDHSYWSHGKKIYSVTQIMSQLSVYKFANIDKAVLENKARIGTMTHEFGELLFDNKELTIAQYLEKTDPFNLWGDEYRDTVVAYWTAMHRYWKEKQPPFFASELKVFDTKDNLAGTIDNLGFDGASGTFYISDYKTSAKIDLFMQPLQLFAYANALNHILGDTFFTKGLLVQLKRDGTYEEYWFDLNDYKTRWYLLLENFQTNVLEMLEEK